MHFDRYVVVYEPVIISQTVFHRDRTVIGAMSQEGDRSVLCNLLLERISYEHLFALVLAKKIVTGAMMSELFMHGDDRIYQYREVRSCDLVNK